MSGLPDPQTATVYATRGLSGYSIGKSRYSIVIGPARENHVWVTTLTTDKYNKLGQEEAIDVHPDTHPSLYRSRENKGGLPPVPGKISLHHYTAKMSAIFEAQVVPGLSIMIPTHGECAQLDPDFHCRASREDWTKIQNAAPQAYQNKFADYDSI
jgi:hypothetical protein